MKQKTATAVNREVVNPKSSGEHRLCYESTAMKILGNGADMTEQTEWLTSEQLTKRWSIHFFKILDYLQEGLQAYTEYGWEVVDTDSCEHKREYSYEEFKKQNPYPQPFLLEEMEPWARDDELAMWDKHLQQLYKDQPLNIVSPPRSMPMSFRYPEDYREAATAKTRLKRLAFKLPDLMKFEQRHELSPSAADLTKRSAQNVFREEGRGWRIVFQGKQLNLLTAKNLYYIYKLLSLYMENRNTYTISAIELENIVEERLGSLNNSANDTCLKLDVETLDKDNLSVVTYYTDNTFDDPGKYKLQIRLEELKEEMQHAETRGDFEQYDILQGKHDEIESYLFETYGKHKGDRYKDSEAGALLTGAKKRIHSKITRVLKKIKTISPDLHRHLSESLKPLGSNLSYHPPQHIEWDLQSSD